MMLIFLQGAKSNLSYSSQTPIAGTALPQPGNYCEDCQWLRSSASGKGRALCLLPSYVTFGQPVVLHYLCVSKVCTAKYYHVRLWREPYSCRAGVLCISYQPVLAVACLACILQTAQQGFARRWQLAQAQTQVSSVLNLPKTRATF